MPLVIGLVVATILIVLLVSYFVTSRIGTRMRISRRRSDRSEREPITGPNIEMSSAGQHNPQVEQTYEDADIQNENDGQSHRPRYHTIGDDPGGSPATPVRTVGGHAEPRNPYSRGVYNQNNMEPRPSLPERRTQPSPGYSTNIRPAQGLSE